MSVSLVTVDSYQANPLPGLDDTFSDFRGSEIKQVPVIRIFGSTSDGKKTCLHIHGAYPYMYVPCMFEKNVDSYAYQLATALDTAINLSLGLTNSSKQHVYKIQRVSGIPFYGYHQKEHTFFKIYFYNPAMIKRAADVLQNGAVFNQNLQPYEAHIPFILQFMVDYNLYGMSFIYLDDIKYQRHSRFKMKDNTTEENTHQSYNLHEDFVPLIMKQTTCQVELDVCVSNIINREAISKGIQLNPGLSAIWDEERFRRNCAGLEYAKSQLLYSQASNRITLQATANDTYQRQRLIQQLQITSQDTASSLNSNTLCYPLESTNEDYIPSASCVLHHNSQSVIINKPTENLKHKQETNELMLLSKTSQNQLQQKTNDTISFDSEDRCLVEMLVHLANDNNEMGNVIDNDSVLGTHFLMCDNEVESDVDNDGTENLNITTSTLINLSSWELENDLNPEGNCLNNYTDTDFNDSCLNMIKDNDKLNLAQYDGADDKSMADSYEPSIKIQTCCMQQTKCVYEKRLVSNIISTLSYLKSIIDEKHLLHGMRQNKNKYQNFHCLLSSSARSSIKSMLIHFLAYNIEKYMEVVKNLFSRFYRHMYDVTCLKAGNLTNVIDIHGDIFNGKKLYWLKRCWSLLKFITVTRCNNVHMKQFVLKSFRHIYHYLLPVLHREKRYILQSMNLVQAKGLQSYCCNRHIMQSNHYKSIPHVHFNDILLRTSKLNHKDLDVYVVHEMELANITSQNTKFINMPKIDHITLRNKKMNICRETLYDSQLLNKQIFISSVPAFDGCSGNSDSEPEVDVVIHKQDNMDLSLQQIVEHTTSKTRRHNCDHRELSFCSKHTDDDIKDKQQSDNLSSKYKERLQCNASIKTGKLKNLSCLSQDYSQIHVTESDQWKINTSETLQRLPAWNVINLFKNNKIVEKSSEQNTNNETNEQNVTCNITFTQCVNQKLSQNDESLLVDRNVHSKTVKTGIKIATRFNPPSYQRVSETIETYKILQCRHRAASSRKRKVTQKEIKEETCTFSMTLFKSSLQDVISINVWRRMKVNEFHSTGMNMKSVEMKQVLASYKAIKITSLIKPPSLKDIFIRLKGKKYMPAKNFETENSTSLVKYVYISGGNGDDVIPDGHNMVPTRTKACQECQIPSGIHQSLLHTQSGNLLSHKTSESLRPLGMSYGQIDFSTKSVSDCIPGDFQTGQALTAHHYLTILSLEIHVTTREDLLPDPQTDSIEAIFYAVECGISASSTIKQTQHGAIVVSHNVYNSKMRTLLSSNTSCSISYVNAEENVLDELATVINRYDPDILIGWQVETLSWGYILQRAHYLKYSNFSLSISRIVNCVSNKQSDRSDTNSSDIQIPGRIVLDAWRIMKHELTLLNYTFENVMFNVMHERIPCPNSKVLTNWWKQSSIVTRCRVIDHYIVRVLGTLRIMSRLDIIGRSSEHARLFGIQLYEVFSRGSQYRVESMMLRLAKPLNYVLISPSIQQKAKMRAPEAVPLILEPRSMFYTDPLIVLDFQSLYPSIIIAYNYCFSTCLGRVEYIGQVDPFEFGAGTLRVTKKTAIKLQDKINFAPCGVTFVKPEVRRGILPRMLEEILNTRLMVKESMKIYSSDNHSLQRTLHSQQLGLKLIANVTYGYTAANFSGRMPCVEVADSVVSKGRETLERAIKIVESSREWGAQVVYGDTDSLFVLLPGKTRKQAFAIGMEIADAVTAANPPPVKLKFEKILHPCILQTKKRYCGYMYETPEQDKAKYMAKGIETVRRDGCPVVAKILEKTLKILFDSKDISLVKSYVVRQLDKVIRKRISIEDLTFAKEFRGINGYKRNACVPALELTRRLMRKDPRAVPRQGERVRYIIVAGAPDQPLIHCVRTPWEVICNPCLSPNSVYYITKVIIPPLNRCLNLMGIDINTWYREMSHPLIFDKAVDGAVNINQKVAIYQFFNAVTCIICAEQSTKSICSHCLSQPSRTMIILHEKIRQLERSYYEVNSICLSCTGQVNYDFECASLDCSTLYRVKEAQKYLAKLLHIKNIINCATNSFLVT